MSEIKNKTNGGLFGFLSDVIHSQEWKSICRLSKCNIIFILALKGFKNFCDTIAPDTMITQ